MMTTKGRKLHFLALLMTVLVCLVSCFEEHHTEDEDKLQDATTEHVLDKEEMVDSTFATVAAESETRNSISDEIEKQKEELEEFAREMPFFDEMNSTMINEDSLQINATITEEKLENISESGDVKQKSRWSCNLFSSENEDPKVMILTNETQLNKIATTSNESQSCFLLYFFVKWCEFCAEFSVEINAIGRIFHGLPVIAVDAYSLSSVAGKFGITGVPSLILFYDGRPVAKFNRSRTLQGLEDFITHSTGLTPNKSVDIQDCDFAGPLSTKVEEQGDIYLLLSIVSITFILLINLCLTDRVTSFFMSSVNKFKEWAIHQKRD